jgi:hypothetical protein
MTSTPLSGRKKIIPDYLMSFKAADMLCRKIRRYWYDKGLRDYNIRVERMYFADENSEVTTPYYVIRSNLVFSVPEEFRKSVV